jgi:hypothetical protein
MCWSSSSAGISRPVRPRKPHRGATLLLCLALAEIGIFLDMGFMRPDTPVVMICRS